MIVDGVVVGVWDVAFQKGDLTFAHEKLLFCSTCGPGEELSFAWRATGRSEPQPAVCNESCPSSEFSVSPEPETMSTHPHIGDAQSHVIAEKITLQWKVTEFAAGHSLLVLEK